MIKAIACLVLSSTIYFEIYANGFVQPQQRHMYSSSSRGELKVTPQENEFRDDNSIEEYSRCLSPKEEKAQINEELGFKQDSRLKRSLKSMGRAIKSSFQERKSPGTLILVRGGESLYSKNYTFTGWLDPDLTKDGVLQMEHAGRLLLESGFEPDVIYTSRLKRAINSCWAIMQELNAPFLPIYKSWRLNERHYGSLQGLSKKKTAESFGSKTVQAWRRSLKARPPPMTQADMTFPGNDRKYSDLLPEQIPLSESLYDCMLRTEPLWKFIKKNLQKGDNVLVVAHANTLRGIAKIIDGELVLLWLFRAVGEYDNLNIFQKI